MNIHYELDPEDATSLHISGELLIPLDYSELSSQQQYHFFEDHFINPLKKKTGCEFRYSHTFVFPSLNMGQCIIEFGTEQQSFFFQLVVNSHCGELV